MINFIKILLQLGSFKIPFMKIQFSFIILRKVSENSVHFSQFQNTFAQKHPNYRTILRYVWQLLKLVHSQKLGLR